MKLNQFNWLAPFIALTFLISILDISEVMAQKPGLIKGIVQNNKNEPLEGVSVIVLNTKTKFTSGTSTDSAGVFSFSNIPSGGPFRFTFSNSGYLSQTLSGSELKEGATLSLVVKLQESVEVMDKVVVTALGIKRQPRSLTYGTQSVSTTELSEARELNVITALEGKVAGLSINTSGSGLGADARVILRGNRSISGDSQPLYVVDGVIIDGAPSDLNADNVASINVLKGPNSAALYGSKAQNGVIIIETKKGQAGGLNISMNNTYMVQEPVLSDQFQNIYGQGNSGVFTKSSEDSWGPLMDGRLVDTWSLNPNNAGTKYAFIPQPNNRNDLFQKGYNMSTNIIVRTGGEKTQTVFSYTFTKAKGIVPNNALTRHNLLLRITNKLSKKLTMDSKIEYSLQSLDNQLSNGESSFNPNRQIYTMPASIRTEDASKFEYVDQNGLQLQDYWYPGTATGANPYWTIYRNLRENDRKRLLALNSLSYDFSSALKFILRASYEGSFTTNSEKSYYNTYRDPQGRYTVGQGNSQLLAGDFLMSYNREINKNWNFNVNLGGDARRTNGTYVSASTGTMMIVPNFFTISNTSLPVTVYSPESSIETHSLYAFGHLGFKNALFLDITGRNDWSSTLPAESRSYFYPSVGMSAVLSDLFPVVHKVFSFAKIRASWAKVGSSAPFGLLQRTATFTAGGNNGFLTLSNSLPNMHLKPESSDAIELGLDMRFFGGRLGFDISGYKTNTSNQLFTIALPIASGASTYFTNGGNVQNKGLEVLVTSTPVKTSLFRWEMNLNFSTNRNKVITISDERPKVVVGGDFYFRDYVVEQGKPFGDVYSRGWLRDSIGRVIIGSDGMPKITAGKTVLVANFTPRWAGSTMNTFTCGNYSMSFLIEQRTGGNVASNTNANLYGQGVALETINGREGGLIFGQNLFSKEVAVKADGSPNDIPVTAEKFWRGVGGRNAPVGEAFVEDATSTRFRELTIGYSIPGKMLNRLPLSHVKLSLVARNLFYIYRAAKDLDTDFFEGTDASSEGFQSFAPPTTRTYGVSLKIDFK